MEKKVLEKNRLQFWNQQANFSSDQHKNLTMDFFKKLFPSVIKLTAEPPRVFKTFNKNKLHSSV